MAADLSGVQKSSLLGSTRRQRGRVDLNTAVRQALLLLKAQRGLPWIAFLDPDNDVFVLTPMIDPIRAALRKSTWTDKLLFWRSSSLPDVIARKIRKNPAAYLVISPKSLIEFCGFLETQAKKAHPEAVVTVHQEKVKEFLASRIWHTRGSKELIELFLEELKTDSQAYVSCVVYRYSSSGRGRSDPAMC